MFFRGLQCPLCVKYRRAFGTSLPDLQTRGARVIAISSDGETRTRDIADPVGVSDPRFAYALPLATARAWGFYISKGKGKTSMGREEPALFAEPGVFSRVQTLYHRAVQGMPFASPSFNNRVSIDVPACHEPLAVL